MYSQISTLTGTIASELSIFRVAITCSIMTPKSIDFPDMVNPKEAKIFPCIMYSFARAAITKYHKLGGLNSRNLFPQSSGS